MTAMDDANKKFVELYNNGTPVAEIASAMGWSTNNPKQMVQQKRTRLIKKGYDIPPRSGRPYEGARMTVDQAQERLDRVYRALQSEGFRIIHKDGFARVVS